MLAFERTLIWHLVSYRIVTCPRVGLSARCSTSDAAQRTRVFSRPVDRGAPSTVDGRRRGRAAAPSPAGAGTARCRSTTECRPAEAAPSTACPLPPPAPPGWWRWRRRSRPRWRRRWTGTDAGVRGRRAASGSRRGRRRRSTHCPARTVARRRARAASSAWSSGGVRPGPTPRLTTDVRTAKCQVLENFYIQICETAKKTSKRPLYRSTCVSRHLQLRTGGFRWCKVLLPACPCKRQPARSE